MFEYKAKVTRVVDGDTLDVAIDLGFGIVKHDRLRILNLDTPETYGRASPAEKLHGKEATEYASDLFDVCPNVIIKTKKDKQGKYGRYLAEVVLQGEHGVGDLRYLHGVNYAIQMKQMGFQKRDSYE